MLMAFRKSQPFNDVEQVKQVSTSDLIAEHAAQFTVSPKITNGAKYFGHKVADKENYKLVPCRWSKSGWKYVIDEPYKNDKFFNSPNRVNG